jgi:hypothetical protein
MDILRWAFLHTIRSRGFPNCTFCNPLFWRASLNAKGIFGPLAVDSIMSSPFSGVSPKPLVKDTGKGVRQPALCWWGYCIPKFLTLSSWQLLCNKLANKHPVVDFCTYDTLAVGTRRRILVKGISPGLLSSCNGFSLMASCVVQSKRCQISQRWKV